MLNNGYYYKAKKLLKLYNDKYNDLKNLVDLVEKLNDYYYKNEFDKYYELINKYYDKYNYIIDFIEGKIKYLIKEKNWLDAVIGLPENLFYGVSIPATIVIFKKNRNRDGVLFIEASREYEKGKNQNTLTKENIEKILNTYKKLVIIN